MERATDDSLSKQIDMRWDSHYREQELRDNALRIQAAEYERRLELLNNENSRINSVLQKSVSSELYRSEQKETRDKLTFVMQQIVSLTDRVTTAEKEMTSLNNSLVWLIRLLGGAAILGFLSYATQHFVK